MITSKLAVLLAFGLLGCGGSGAGAEKRVVDTVGVEIVMNDVAADQIAEWRLADEPYLSIGDLAPTPEYNLYRVYYARSFPDGRVLVSMDLTEMRLYDETGRHLLTIGREGEGPGEFQFLWDAHPLDGDEIRAFDIRNRKVSFFNAITGELLRETPLVTPWSNPNGLGVLQDFRYAGLVPRYPDDPRSTPDVRVLVHEREGRASDTIGSFSAPDGSEPPGDVRAVFQPSFSSTAAGPYVWAGWEGHYEIKRYHEDTGLDRIIRAGVEAAPVTEEMREAVGATGSDGTREPDFPARLPSWNKLMASHSGWLWVRRYSSPVEDGPHRWDVFDPDGLQRAWILVPSSGRITEVGDDYVLGVFRDELDVERVQKYEILKGPEREGR